MKNEAQKLEKQIADLTMQNSTVLTDLRNKKLTRDSEEWKQYKATNEKIDGLKKQLYKVNLKARLNTVNAFNAEVSKLIHIIAKEYKGQFVKADGSSTKKFKDFAAGLDTAVTVYAINKTFRPKIVFVGGHGLRFEIDLYMIDRFEDLPQYDAKEVLQAQTKHNKLLKEYERIKSELRSNYFKATANGEVHHYGQTYQF